MCTISNYISASRSDSDDFESDVLAIEGGGLTRAAKIVAAIAWTACGGDRPQIQKQGQKQPQLHITQRPPLPPSFTGTFHPFLHPSFAPLLTYLFFGCGLITIR